ncbi:MAG: hypothetical protein ACTSO3_16750 [Candidatus Heimdallarchaeaceae archaeon]
MKRKFTENEVEKLVWENDVETIKGEDRRWSRTNKTIVEVDGKHFALEWEQGLTESQENYYEDQEADEVSLVEYEVTKTVSEWMVVK